MRRFTEKNTARRGFTVVELIVVIAVIAILAGILIPTFGSIMEDSEQRRLRIELDTAYTAFAADCGFRDEPVKNIGQYTFVPADALSFSTTGFSVKANGYSWDGSDNGKVASVASGSIDTSASTAVYGPFNGYYLLGAGMALNWSGTGSVGDPFVITSYAELRTIAERVARGNSFSGQVFRLDADLYVANSSWLPIGGFVSPTQPSDSAVFSGTFDGNGYCISLAYGRVDLDNYCLFGYTSNATIKNLKVSGQIAGNANMGGIVGKANNTTVQNCFNTALVKGDHHVGGIVGNATGSTKILGCVNTGAVEAYLSASDNAVGGIAGETASGVTVQDCNNRGKILASGGAAGGIVGIARGNVKFCVNSGAVEAKGNAAQQVSGGKDALAGGIAGWGAKTATIDSCGNTGNITAANRCVGGIVGADAKTLKNCANTGTVTANSHVGGIAGLVTNTSYSIANVMNGGNVVAKGELVSGSYTGCVGGIIGRVNGAYTLNLAANSGQIHYRKGVAGATSNQAGQIVGAAGGTVTLTNAFVTSSTAVYVGNSAAAATAVGGTSTAATVKSSQSDLASALNGAVGSSYSQWTKKNGYYGSKYVPVNTKLVTYNTKVTAGTIALKLDTSFVGASTIYGAFPEQRILSTDTTKYTFQSWTIGGSSCTAGQSFSVSADVTATANWKTEAHKVEPLPFG